MSFTPRLSVLGFVLSPDRRDVLMVHRTARPHDPQLGKFNGLGGKVERGEHVTDAMARELAEESGLRALDPVLRGTLSWPGFRADGDDFGFIFLIERWTGRPWAANEEGPLSWRPIAGLAELPMHEGDRHFLPLVFDERVAFFDGVMPYRDGRPIGWRVAITRRGADGR